ncbi:17996_t:CDS:2 [Gigaspora margarita]|uniref:17996_t:CDS:1 n=1 Tax=Gigaspora margarita TaxID=4874 RepID=A0ABN7V8E7_GIGMA|nr:17996_t:CDS:2 [Gigaspora margarita]
METGLLGKNTLGNTIKEITHVSGINVIDQRITNHLERRTAIQLLSDLNVNEHEMMQFSESQVIQHEVQITQHKEFQTTEQKVIQDNSLVMQQEFNATTTQIKSQVSRRIVHKKKPRFAYEDIQAKLNKPF